MVAGAVKSLTRHTTVLPEKTPRESGLDINARAFYEVYAMSGGISLKKNDLA